MLLVILASFVASLAVIVLSAVLALQTAKREVNAGAKGVLKLRVAPAKWDFGKSWASNLTALAILTTLIGADRIVTDTSLPTWMNLSEVLALDIVFLLMIPVSQLLYIALQQPLEVSDETGNVTYQDQGFVWSFLLASSLVVWAALGELGLTFYIAFSLGDVNQTLQIFLQVMTLVATAILVLYVYRSTATLLLNALLERPSVKGQFQEGIVRPRKKLDHVLTL